MTLTEKDLDEIEELIEKKIKHLPTKDEFYRMMNKIIGELEKMRQELKITNHHFTRHEDRIANLEEIHPQGQHAPA